MNSLICSMIKFISIGEEMYGKNRDKNILKFCDAG